MSLKNIHYRLFIEENTMDPKLQLLSQLIQSSVYVTIINGLPFYEVLGVFAQSYIIFTALILLFLFKLTCGITIRFGINLIALQIIIFRADSWMAPSCILLAMILASQFLSSITFDYSSSSIQVESRIYNKVFRVLLLIGNTIILTLVKNPTYVHLSSGLLFLILLWSKQRSLMKSEEYRAIALRFYLFAACEHIRVFLSTFFPTANTLPAAVASFFLSQSLFALLVHCRPVSNCHQLLAKQQHLRLAFLLLRYTHSSSYDPKIEEFISSFSIGDNQEVQEGKQTDVKSRLNASSYSSQALSIAVLDLLNKSEGFLQAILRSEVHAEAGRLLLAKQILQKARQNLTRYSLLRKVVLLHVEKRLSWRFSHSSSKVTILHEEAWHAFLQFQQILHRAASQHLKFNLYLKRAQIELAKIKQICFKIISMNKKVTSKFEKIRGYFAASTELMVSFLVLVLGDYQMAETVLNRQKLNQKQLLECSVDEKIFVRLHLSVDGLIIDRVGFNSRELLGFTRDQLQGQTLERLVPSFFRATHQQLSKVLVHDFIERRILFQKQTVILNGRGTYNACQTALRLVMGQDGFSYEGYIRVFANDTFDLDYFFIVGTNGSFHQSFKGLIDEDDTITPFKMEQLFQGTIGGPLVRTNSKKLYQIYDPIIFNSGENPFYFYAKRASRKTQEQIIKEVQLIETSLKEKTAPMLQAKTKSFLESTKQQAENDQQDETQSYIKNKQICALFVVIVLLILGLFFSQYLIIYSANVKYNNQSFSIGNTLNLIQYYNLSSKLELNLIYLNFRDTYNYTNSLIQLDLQTTALNMHTINQRLKRFNLGKYNLSTFNSAIKYQQSNYQLILLIVAEAYIYQHFKNDSFMKTAAIDQSKAVIPVQATQSVTDYRISIVSLMNSFVQNDVYYETLSFWINTANILIFFFLAIRLFWKLKQVEGYAISKRCEGFFHIKKIKEIVEFLKEITIEEVPIDKLSQEMQVYEIASMIQNNISTLMSEASLIRENTARNMSIEGNIPLETVNKTGFVENMQKVDNQQKPVQESRYTFRKTKSYVMVLIVFGLFMGVLITLNVSNQIFNVTNKNLDEVSSLLSVLLLYKPAAIYSDRCVILTFNNMLQKNEKGVDTSTSFLSAIKGCQAFVNSYTFPIFPQMRFNEFSDFASGYNKLYQQTLCSYVKCDPLFYDQLNLNFVSVIKQYSLSLATMYKTTMNYTIAQMATYLTTTNKRYVDLLFYTEDLVRAYIANLMTSYVNSYNLFMNTLYSSKYDYAISMISISIAGLVTFLIFVWHIRKEQNNFIRMIKLYGNDV